MRGERRVRERKSATNGFLKLTVSLERGGHGVIEILRVCLRRQSIINEGLFLDPILGLMVT